MRLGIDATNIGGGGGITHLKEVINAVTNNDNLYGITEIIVFSSHNVLNEIADNSILKKVSYKSLNQGLIERVKFQIFSYDKEINKYCDILFSLTGDYIGKFKPIIGMSQNMLLYERDIWSDIKSPKEIMRFWLNFQKQKRCFKNSSGIIFISEYAKQYINNALEINNKQQKVIYHGISPQFKGDVQVQKDISEYSFKNPFNFLYVSTIHVYKNQWNVVRAISNLRQKGFPISLTLVGGVIFKPAGDLLSSIIEELDPEKKFVENKGNVPYSKITEEYNNALGIIFASNCENMPNILIESMSSGKPIVCSNKAPMPEFLKTNGFYFDPKDVESLENSIIDFLMQPLKRESMAKKNIQEVKKYSWGKTASETLSFIQYIFNNNL